MNRKRSKQGGSKGSPAWTTTFSDLMTLLLTFFVLLYSFSTLDAEKFKNIANALQTALTGQGAVTIFENDTPPGEIPIEEMNPSPDDLTNINNETKEIYEIVYNFIDREGLEAEVSIRADHRGVIIDIKDTILFDSGKANLKSGSKSVLEKITKLINEFENEIIVEGHTDNVPMNNSRFPTNWELSVTRATTVVRYFVEERSINPERLSAAGYGEYSPIVPNNNSNNRALNRRVNILIVTSQEGER
jgi:chemotaxis protein MotB